MIYAYLAGAFTVNIVFSPLIMKGALINPYGLASSSQWARILEIVPVLGDYPDIDIIYIIFQLPELIALMTLDMVGLYSSDMSWYVRALIFQLNLAVFMAPAFLTARWMSIERLNTERD